MPRRAHKRLSRSIKLNRQREGRLGVALSGPLRATMTWRARPELLDNKRPAFRADRLLSGYRTVLPPWQAVSGLS